MQKAPGEHRKTIKRNETVEKILQAMNPGISKEARISLLAKAFEEVGLIRKEWEWEPPKYQRPEYVGKFRPGVHQINERGAKIMAEEWIIKDVLEWVREAMTQVEIPFRYQNYIEKELWKNEKVSDSERYRQNLKYQTLGLLAGPVLEAVTRWYGFYEAANLSFEFKATNSEEVDRLRGNYEKEVKKDNLGEEFGELHRKGFITE
jgi:hypothetical protein